MLTKLPNEILEHIMLYCEGVDRYTAARCSKHLNTIMEPFIWEAVYITTNLLTNRWDDSLFNKFRHAKTMKIDIYIPKSSPRPRGELERNLTMILDNIQPPQVIEAIIDISSPTRGLCSKNFIQTS